MDADLADRDVILVRDGAGIRIEGSGASHYSKQFHVMLGGTTFPFVRGYAWADVAVGSTTIRFITTHLESQSAKLARALPVHIVYWTAWADAGGPVRFADDVYGHDRTQSAALDRVRPKLERQAAR